MDMGVHPDERALLRALIAAAAPHPLAPDQAIPLLGRVDEPDVAALGRLAYHALTGVDPGPLADPPPPADVVPGFPSFASEVIQRAIAGPDHRRPTNRALIVVLETTRSSNWPTSGRPHLVIGEDGPVASDDPTEPRPDRARTEERQREHAEFRSLLIPSREVPRFDPLVDTPTAPEAAPDAASPTDEPADVVTEDVEPEPVDDHEAFRRVVVTGHAIPRFEPLEGTVEVPGLGDDVVRRRRSSRRRHTADHDMHPQAPAVQPAPVPHIPLDVEPAPGEPVATPRTVGAPEPVTVPDETVADEPVVAALATPAPRPGTDRRETFIVVAVLAVLILLAAVYAAAQQADQPTDSGLPQGASRVSSHPLDVRT